MVTKFTTLPCRLKLRLNVKTGEFLLRGDMGYMDKRSMTRAVETKLSVNTNTENLLALSAFFLARAQERLLLDLNDD